LLDPAISIEDLDATVHGFVAGYARSVNLFGKSGLIDAVIPFAAGDWSGLVNQQQQSTSRNGFGDPRIRISWNLAGAPALTHAEYKDYQQKTIFGVNLQIYLPLGQYFPDRLINLGSNRFTIRPQIGLSHRINNWYLEAYTSIWYFAKNPDFWGGNELTQNTLFTTKIHLIRSLPKGKWLAFNAGYANGGTSYVNGEKRDSHISTFRLGGTIALPIGLKHSLKLYGFTTFRMDKGSDYDLLAIAYQYRWGNR
jgi:hypothetical protein